MTTRSSSIGLAVVFTIGLALGCGDGGKRPLGATCEDAAECSSGLCYGGSCIDPAGDGDDDGVLNSVELGLTTDPFDPDSDGDGVGDGAEIGEDQTTPSDGDGDGKSDALESASADGDRDCIADQLDPSDDDVRPARALEVCQRTGLCAEHSESLSARCTVVAEAAPLWQCNPSTVPGWAASDSRCDGVDEDCDGASDEDFVPGAVACRPGACAAAAETRCNAGVLGDSCVYEAAADDASCDGVDDDCDGATDEEALTRPSSCGVGACAAAGTLSCSAGVERDDCVAGSPAADDASCDGADDDCDGTDDEDHGVRVTSCGQGACRAEGSVSCEDGAPVVDCTALEVAAADDASCDGSDSDCDGVTDEDFAVTITRCGVGACERSGERSCSDGGIDDSCAPAEAAAADASCDGSDDDCNGVADEDFVPAATICGTGACAAVGVTSCVAGELRDSCVPGEPAAADTSCDGVDDDCSGGADEDFVPFASSCGTGACLGTGVVTCVTGAPADDCVAGSPLSADDTACDGVDANCDGATDEGFVATPTSCGTGACAGSGVTTCVGGEVGDSCEAGSGEARDADCDGVDDDCDEATDEDYEPAVTSCGIGGCGREGELRCVAGEPEDTCVPGTPAPNDDTCDGVDDDCDLTPDEDYPTSGTSCGAGECEASGLLRCFDGDAVDSCVPLEPDCAGRQCGDDGCDGSCGDCPAAPAACVAISCSAAGQCLSTVTTGCYIAGSCHVAGVKNPANECQLCDPAVDTTGWSGVKQGTPCTADANSCTFDRCDGLGSCDADDLPELSACDDGNAATIGDWCLASSCGGFHAKVEPRVTPPPAALYNEMYRRAGPGPTAGSVMGSYRYALANDNQYAGVTTYSSGTVPPGIARLERDEGGLAVALDTTRVVHVDTLWEYVAGAWTNARDAGTLRGAWGYSGDEFPDSYERIIRYNTGSIATSRANVHGVGRNNVDNQLVVRHCSVSNIFQEDWRCAGQQIATPDINSYPASIVRVAGVNYLFANAGSRSAPTATKVLKLGAAWAADTALTKSASTELKEVAYSNTWYVGAGNTTHWVTKLAGYSNIVGLGTYVFWQTVTWNGYLLVLGSAATTTAGATTYTAVLAYAPIGDSVSSSAAWKTHRLWTNDSLVATGLVAVSADELYVLGGDRLGTSVLSPTVRAVWRYSTGQTPL